MPAKWRRLLRCKDLTVSDDAVTVSLPDGRRHFVRVEDREDFYRLSAVVVGAAVGNAFEDLPLRTWLRNRGTELVGFGIDQRGRLIGSCWVPKAGLSEAELQLYARTLAAECDRYEFELTGKDA